MTFPESISPRAIVVLIAGIGLGSVLTGSVVAGSIVFSILITGVAIATRIFQSDQGATIEASLIGVLLWLSVTSLGSALVYRFASLSQPLLGAVVITVVIASGYLIWSTRQQILQAGMAFSIPQHFPWGLFVLWLLNTVAAYGMLAAASTAEALRSPWSVLTEPFFAAVFAAHLLGILLLTHVKWPKQCSVLVLVPLAGLHITVPLIVYRIGFGFDQFIHQATERLILLQGSVSPKPWYYLGQYSLNTVLSWMTNIDVITLDRALLPLLATLMLPALILFSRPTQSPYQHAIVVSYALLALPLALFIQTTPQGLANLLFLSLLFLLVTPLSHGIKYGCAALLAAAAFFIHPIAGIPACLITTLVWLYDHEQRKLAISCTIFVTLLLPALFWFVQRANVSTAQFLDPLGSSRSWLYIEQRYQFFLDAVYHFGFNIGIVYALIAGAALWYLWRSERLAAYGPFLLVSAALVIDGFVLSRAPFFNYLIPYERLIFAGRFYELGALAMLPVIVVALYLFAERLFVASRALQGLWFIVLAALATAGVYLTSPRFDGYAFDRGYSTSSHDLRTVASIESNSGKMPYTVLANQAVSAAALQELGFKQYFERQDVRTGEQIFFYPIPTGGSLYQYYLSMVYDKPSHETAVRAMNLTGTHRLYFVLNDYWTDFDTLVPAAKESADRWWTIDDGKNYIFEYRR